MNKVYLFEPCDLLEKAVANMLSYFSLESEIGLGLKNLPSLVEKSKGKTLFVLDTDHISDDFLIDLMKKMPENVSAILLIQPDYIPPVQLSIPKIIALEKPFLMNEMKNALKSLGFLHENEQEKPS